MHKLILIPISLLALIGSFSTIAMTCPDVKTSSLAEGKVPRPWVISDFSRKPRADEFARFEQAGILLSGGKGFQADCTYRDYYGNYTIILKQGFKVPRGKKNWYPTVGAFVCNASIDACRFHRG